MIYCDIIGRIKLFSNLTYDISRSNIKNHNTIYIVYHYFN